MVPDYIEIALTWANVGVGQNQGTCLLHGSQYVTGNRTQSYGLFNVFYNNSLIKQIHLSKRSLLNLIWECKKCLPWQKYLC